MSAIAYSEPLESGPYYRRSKSGYKNGDRSTPYPYKLLRQSAVFNVGPGNNGTNRFSLITGQTAGSADSQSLDMARARFIDLLSYNREGSWGENVLTARKSLSMVTLRFNQLRGMLPELLNFLASQQRNARRKKVVINPAAFGKYWLEWWMGWAPLVSDIFLACATLSGQDGAAHHKRKLVATSTKIHQSRSTLNTSAYLSVNNYDVKCTAKVGATVVITNPNLFLANQLGLANPLATAWQVMPWSWLVNWVYDVESYLRSLSEFYGVSLEKAYYTQTRRTTYCDCYWIDKATWSVRYKCIRYKNVVMERKIGFPPMSLPKLGMARISPTRAATAASLLAQRMSKIQLKINPVKVAAGTIPLA